MVGTICFIEYYVHLRESFQHNDQALSDRNEYRILRSFEREFLRQRSGNQ